MPASLEILDLSAYTGSRLPQLPDGIKILILNKFQGSAGNTYIFPSSLEKLWIPSLRYTNTSLQNLTNLKKICTNYLSVPPGVTNECNWSDFIKE
jgi:hypothetical protein